jgi:hypothetical protein
MQCRLEGRSLSRLSKDGKAFLAELFSGGPLADLLQDLEDKVKEMSVGLASFDLADPQQLPKAQALQAMIKGYLLALGEIKENILGSE